MNYKPNTIKTYNMSLKQIKSLGFNPENINIDLFIEYLKQNKINLKTQNQYLSSLQWNNIQTINDNTISKKLTEEIKQIRILINEEYDKNELSEREKRNYIPWDIILKIYEDIRTKIQTTENKKLHENYLLLSLYIIHPPRRCDYQNMYLSNIDITQYKNRIITTNTLYSNEWFKLEKSIKQTRLKNDKENTTNQNHYIKNNDSCYFIFDDYKTFKFYGRQIIEVKTELNNIIKNYITLFNLKIGDKLLNLSYSNYTKRIMLLFDSYVNRKPSIDLLRHSFINNLLKKYQIKYGFTESASIGERKEISLLMAHSITTQSIYYKYYDYNEIIELNLKPKKIYKKIDNLDEKLKLRKQEKQEWYQKNKTRILQNQKIKYNNL